MHPCAAKVHQQWATRPRECTLGPPSRYPNQQLQGSPPRAAQFLQRRTVVSWLCQPGECRVAMPCNAWSDCGGYHTECSAHCVCTAYREQHQRPHQPTSAVSSQPIDRLSHPNCDVATVQQWDHERTLSTVSVICGPGQDLVWTRVGIFLAKQGNTRSKRDPQRVTPTKVGTAFRRFDPPRRGPTWGSCGLSIAETVWDTE